MGKPGMRSLNYGDVQVSFEDFSLLLGPRWINDALISFVFEYYRQDIYQKQHDTIAFIPPEVTQIIKMLPDDDNINQFAQTLNLQSKDLVFLPINDNDDESCGGTHWSLLVYFRFSENQSASQESSNLAPSE